MEFVGSHRGEGFALEDADLERGTLPLHALGAAAVVLKEEDDRIVQHPLPAEPFDHAADIAVHARYDSGINFHAADFEILVLHRAPRNHRFVG